MRDASVGERYARALFIVTEKRKETPRALEDLKGLEGVFRRGSKLSGYLASPEVRLAVKRESMRRALEGRALPIVAVFVDLLLRKKRLPLFADIVVEFEALVEKAQGVRRVQVVSAVALKKNEMERLEKALAKHLDAKIKVTTSVEPELLGGALVRIGDRVLDRSVRTLLETMSRQLYEVSV